MVVVVMVLVWKMVVGAPDVGTQDPGFHVSKIYEFYHTNTIFAQVRDHEAVFALGILVKESTGGLSVTLIQLFLCQ